MLPGTAPARLPRAWPPEVLRHAGMAVGRQIESVASALARQVTAHPGLSWVAFVALFLVAARPLLQRPLWFDEIVTYHITKLPHVGDVWAAVRTGGDSAPPLFHALNRTVFAVFGEGAPQLRLPSLFGFLAMSGFLYLFVRRRCSAVAAWSAALAPLLTSGAAYMAEGRAYGVVVGFAAAALLCWQRSTLQPGGAAWLAGAAVSIAGAASCHPVGVFALAPIVCGEVTHQIAGAHVRWHRWFTLALGLLPTVVMGHILSSFLGITRADGWDTPRVSSLLGGYRILLGFALLPPVACLCVMAGLRSDWRQMERREIPWLRLPETVAGFGFLLIPPLAVVAGMLSGGPYVPRYGIAGLIGFGVLAAGVTVLVERRRTMFASVFLCALLAGLGLQIAERWVNVEPQFALPATLTSDETDLPIVVEGPLDYLQLAYYAPPGLKERLVSLVDPPAAKLHVGTWKGDLTLVLLQPWAPSLRIETPATFLGSHRRFLVFRGTTPGWVLAKLTAEGAEVTLVRFRNTDAVFEVRVPPAKATAKVPITVSRGRPGA